MWWFPRSGRFILPCQHNWGPIFLFSEVEVGGSALFANVIPNRSYTNAIRAVFGSVLHKIDWQPGSIISEMLSAILWAIAFFRREIRTMSTMKVKTYPHSCRLLCWKIICKPPRDIRFTESVGPNQIFNFCSTPTETHHKNNSTNKVNNGNASILRDTHKQMDIM